MITGFARDRHDHPAALAAVGELLVRRGNAARQCVGQFMCGMRSHLMLMRFQPQRLFLQCAWCGYESPGWEIGKPPRHEHRQEMRPMKRPTPLNSGTVRRVA